MALEVELEHYNSIKDDLLKHHAGKYALIVGREVLGIFDHAEEAYKVGLEQKGHVPMLIKQVLRDDPVISIPALSLGLLRANS
jgi:hypothetical protein